MDSILVSFGLVVNSHTCTLHSVILFYKQAKIFKLFVNYMHIV